MPSIRAAIGLTILSLMTGMLVGVLTFYAIATFGTLHVMIDGQPHTFSFGFPRAERDGR